MIDSALGDAKSIVNVGAGAGSYEPVERCVVAVEPSRVMLDQHPGPLRVRAVAGSLPLLTGSFDAAMAIMTIHHWPDVHAGVAELRRVAHRQAVFTWDPDFEPELWIVSEYVPEIGQLERSRFPSLAEVVAALDAHTVVPFEIPWDFTDGYQPAFWRRPEAYLDPVVRAASSTFAVLPDDVVARRRSPGCAPTFAPAPGSRGIAACSSARRWIAATGSSSRATRRERIRRR